MNQIIDIYSKGEYPADCLSNFYPHAFVIDGVPCASMEGFLQSLKYRSRKKQRAVCALAGKEAKKKGRRKFFWRLSGTLYWNGVRIKRQGTAFSQLLMRAYLEMYLQCPAFREALAASEGKELAHSIGGSDPKRTVLTEREFIACLLLLRTYRGEPVALDND